MSIHKTSHDSPLIIGLKLITASRLRPALPCAADRAVYVARTLSYSVPAAVCTRNASADPSAVRETQCEHRASPDGGPPGHPPCTSYTVGGGHGIVAHIVMPTATATKQMRNAHVTYIRNSRNARRATAILTFSHPARCGSTYNACTVECRV